MARGDPRARNVRLEALPGCSRVAIAIDPPADPSALRRSGSAIRCDAVRRPAGRAAARAKPSRCAAAAAHADRPRLWSRDPRVRAAAARLRPAAGSRATARGDRVDAVGDAWRSRVARRPVYHARKPDGDCAAGADAPSPWRSRRGRGAVSSAGGRGVSRPRRRDRLSAGGWRRHRRRRRRATRTVAPRPRAVPDPAPPVSTTVTLSPPRRLQLLALANAHRFAIVEEDYDHEFHFEGRPVLPLASLDTAGVVAYAGTFSKVLAPGCASATSPRRARSWPRPPRIACTWTCRETACSSTRWRR